ncbi:hypothetical protein HJC23_005502 [Cyclotella cryptica]|uniref:Uncharacterized protein n=1 Tax=Cyclotella cryptica TaxID=29204 RepID=A0ABD3PI54_9STRA|eukprot:CCRYP_014877-RA/>CCRYP_014877-RA protein AED:0.11 eAED:0.11 QI:0/-1/0/1/-1/1/1/0/469
MRLHTASTTSSTSSSQASPMLHLTSLAIAAFLLSNQPPRSSLCLGNKTHRPPFDNQLAVLQAKSKPESSIMSTDATASTTTTETTQQLSSAHEKNIAQHAASLVSRVIDATIPTVDDVLDILSALERDTLPSSNNHPGNDDNKEECHMTIALLESTKIGKILTKTIKTCKRHKRGSNESKWDDAIALSERLISTYKRAADAEAAAAARRNQHHTKKEVTSTEGLPPTVATYRERLIRQKKELYKDPPVLPPQLVQIETQRVLTPPRRNKAGELTFTAGTHTDSSSAEALQQALQDFHPNRTPEEILRAGSFGGTYFRPIFSSVTNRRYTSAQVLEDTVPREWIEGLPPRMLSSSTYNVTLNKYKVKCGGSLGMWESSGWISSSDPYGWFQWYCRFYSGRRCSDDVRQIGRWRGVAGERGRFRSQLCNKIVAAGGLERGGGVSPVVRQTLLHWGLEITEEILERHKLRMK